MFTLQTGFEELKLKIYSVKDNEESIEDELGIKVADHLLNLIDQRDHVK
jgi:hypothetical protein